MAREALAWPADSAGGLMNPETVSVRPDVNVDVVLRYLRMRGELPVNTDSVFVVDRDDRYLGVLTFARLLTSDPEAAVTDLMDPSVEAIQATSSATEVAREFQDRDLMESHLHHPLANAQDQAAVLGDLHEATRPKEASLGMVPSEKCLKAGYLARAKGEDGRMLRFLDPEPPGI